MMWHMSTRKLPTDDVLGLVRDLRVITGISQRELAKHLGVSQTKLCRLESGGIARLSKEHDQIARQAAIDLIDGLRAKV